MTNRTCFGMLSPLSSAFCLRHDISPFLGLLAMGLHIQEARPLQ